MKIEISVKPNSRRESVTETAPGIFRVQVAERPVEGRANEAVRELLAEHFGVPKSAVRICHGLKGKTKVVEIFR
jgi:hypothetical protein